MTVIAARAALEQRRDVGCAHTVAILAEITMGVQDLAGLLASRDGGAVVGQRVVVGGGVDR